jgi:serine/threonine protein kinase/Tol biopolymer transport system component
MNRERWQQIDLIFEAALALPANERAAFLDEACAGDTKLRAEVESLIAHEKAEDFMEDPAFEAATRVLAEDTKHSLNGQTIGSYQILESLGAGGMGEVYLALHIRTNRKVALKLLPTAFMRDEQRVQRFQQEARTVLALNHPNIVTVYDIEQAGETHLIAAEVIAGETLRQRMRRAPLKLPEALDVAIQIASALAAAHEAGVVHRDIKPENIMLRPDGFVKVLDFGLAKLTERDSLPASSDLPTIAMIQTDAGTVMGTANYMSPEQARGLEVDARTDIFSFGVVLFEMLTGTMPFAGETKSDVMAAILQNEPPPLVRYWPAAPDALEWIVTKTLTKGREERYQTARDLLTDLKRQKRRSEYELEAARFASTPTGDSASVAKSTGETVNNTLPQPFVSTAEATRTMSSAEYFVSEIKRHKRGVIFAVVGLALLAIVSIGIILGIRYLRPVSVSSSAKPFGQMKVTKLTATGNASQAAISPDGKYVVHVTGGAGKQSLLLRHIATGSDKEIVASNGNDFSWLTFSRDGNYVLYCRVEAGTYPLFQVPVLGGTPQKLTAEDVDSRVSFSPDGKRFAFVRGEPQKGEATLFLANADGTNEIALRKYKLSDFPSSIWPLPSWSPDGENIAFAHRLGDARSTNVVTVQVSDGKEKQITSQRWANIVALSWLADGSGLIITAAEPEVTYVRQVWYVGYPTGEARKITNDANNYVGLSLTADSSAFVTVQVEQAPSVWLAPNGDAARAKQITSSRGDGFAGVAFTPDGKIVYTGSRVSRELWIANADGSGQKQLMIDAKANVGPFVSSDGRYVVFSSARAGASNIWRIDIDGGNLKQLTRGTRDLSPSISPDGQWVFYSATESEKQRVAKVPIDGGDSVQLTDYSAGTPLVAPDGKQLAAGYIDEVKKRWSLAIIPVEGGPPIKTFDISPLQSRYQWSPDGRALLYTVTRDGVSNIWSQPIDGGAPKQLTDFKSDQIFRFSWSSDGKQLVLARGSVSSDVVLINDLK